MVRSKVINTIKGDTCHYGYTVANKPVYNFTVLFGPVVAIESDEHGRHQEEDHDFPDMQPSPVRGPEAPVSHDGWSPGQLLQVIKAKMTTKGNNHNTKEGC